MSETTGWTRYADFYQGSPYAAFPQEHRGSTGRLSCHMIRVDQVDHGFCDPSVSETIIAMTLSAAAGNKWCWDFGDGWRRDSAAPGRMLVLPADTVSRWDVRGARKLLLLTIPSKTIKGILGESAPDNLTEAFLPLTESTWEDPLLQSLMTRLWQALPDSHATDRLLTDSALTTLVTHLLQRSGTSDRSATRVSLPAWKLKRVIEFVEAHLHNEIDILSLAEVAGLSVRQFSRAFKQQVGETPHRWLMRYRIERAENMLHKQRLAIVEVAELCGFSGQSHFTRVFRQITGKSPGSWRNASDASQENSALISPLPHQDREGK